jgi:hypothetical protein
MHVFCCRCDHDQGLPTGRLECRVQDSAGRHVKRVRDTPPRPTAAVPAVGRYRGVLHTGQTLPPPRFLHARFLMKGRVSLQAVQPTVTADTSTSERLSASWVRTSWHPAPLKLLWGTRHGMQVSTSAVTLTCRLLCGQVGYLGLLKVRRMVLARQWTRVGLDGHACSSSWVLLCGVVLRQVSKSTSFAVNDLYFTTSVTLENIGDNTLFDVQYMRNVDPDQEQVCSRTVFKH